MKKQNSRQRSLRPAAVRSQTFVFFAVALFTLLLLCGFGIDAGLLYVHKARLSRAVDAATLMGIAKSGVDNTTTGRSNLALAMRAAAVANYPDLAIVPSTATEQAIDLGNSQTQYKFNYQSTTNSGGKTYTNQILIAMETGSSVANTPTNQIVLTRVEARLPRRTIFMAITGTEPLVNRHVSSSGQAERRPRLIGLILDRSQSMTGNGGKDALPPAVTNFLDKFDEQADKIGIWSYSAFTRQEVPITNYFISAGSNKMYDASTYATSGTYTYDQGMKFNGSTGSDEGVRYALEGILADSGWTSRLTLKYLVFFTDGVFNQPRTLWASPGYLQITVAPTTNITFSGSGGTNNVPYRTISSSARNMTNYIYRPSGSVQARTNLLVTLYPGCVSYYFRTNGTVVTNVSHIYGTNNFSGGTNTFVLSMEPGSLHVYVNPGYTNVPASMRVYPDLQKSDDSDLDPSDTYPYPKAVPSALSSTISGYPEGFIYERTDGSGNTNLVRAKMTNFYGKTNHYGWLFLNSNNQIISNYCVNVTGSNSVPIPDSSGAGPWNGARVYSTNLGYASWAATNLPPYENWNFSGWSNVVGASNFTGGMVRYTNSSGAWQTNFNCMAYSDNPTHMYSFRLGQWVSLLSGSSTATNPTVYDLTTNWTVAARTSVSNTIDVSKWNYDYTSVPTSTPSGSVSSTYFIPECNWKTSNYCYWARSQGIEIYTLGFGSAIATNTTAQDVMKAMANDPSATTTYQPSQPAGKFYLATNSTQIDDFLQDIAGKIRGVLTQ